MAIPAPARHHSNLPLIVGASAAALIVAVVLVWQSASTQTSLQNGRATGTQQRLDQQQVTCALWALLRAQNTAGPHLQADIAAAADRICASAPTPVATKG